MLASARANAVDDAIARVAIVTSFRHLPLRVRLAHPLDDDELFELCAANRDLRIERTAEGELVIMPPTGGETGRRNFELIGNFHAWVRRDGTGVGFDSSIGFLLPNGAERSPDLAWLRKERWNTLTEEQRRKFVPLCPDFVVELRSPTDALAEQQAKLEEYIACGAILGWLLDPEERRAHVYRAGGRARDPRGSSRAQRRPGACGVRAGAGVDLVGSRGITPPSQLTAACRPG
jgi:Uma2 family endonuclease